MLSGYIGHIVIYIPSDTMSGIGADGKYSSYLLSASVFLINIRTVKT